MILQKPLNLMVALISVIYFGGMPVSSLQVGETTTRYVATTGTDAGNCLSSLLPCNTIQYAVNQSSSGGRILVAQGIYTYSAVTNPCPSWARTVICYVDKDLAIFGGYSTNDWSRANPTVNQTIIDGQNTYRGAVVLGYNTTTSHLDMEGFIIQNGRAQGPSYIASDPSGLGGGMWILIASVTLRDIIFRNNQAIGLDTTSGDGGAAFGSALRIESSPAGTSSLLQRVVFDNNQSHGGTGPDRGGLVFGTLFVFESTVNIQDSTFSNNLAQAGDSLGNGVSKSDALHADALGGGIGVENGTINLQHIIVTGNQVSGGNANLTGGTGGGAYGAGIFVEGVGTITSSVTISDSYIANNTAIAGDGATGGNAGGGGILATNSQVTIERGKFISNSAIGGDGGNAGPGAGGGIYLFATRSGIPQAAIKNAMVTNNYVAQGSGVTSLGNGGSAGISIQGVDAEITHATIAQNRLAPSLILGQALGIGPWGSLPVVVSLNYSIIANHTEGGSNATAIVVQVDSTLTFNHGLFVGNNHDTNASGGPVSPGIIRDLTTMYSASSAGFISPGSPSYNYHLRLDSPAKDQASGSTTSSDIDGQIRPFNGVSDYGADEVLPFILSVAPGDGSLHLDWTAGMSVLAGGVNHYGIIVTCPTGANPPQEGSCGQSINAGMTTNFKLTGLTNNKQYTMIVNAYDSSGVVMASSIPVKASPVILKLLYLPLINR